MPTVAAKLSALAEKWSDLTTREVKELIARFGKQHVAALGTLTGASIQNLRRDLGDDVLRKLAESLGGDEIELLARDLTPGVLKRLTDDLDGAAVKALADSIGANELGLLATTMTGGVVRELHDAVGGAALKDLVGAAERQTSQALMLAIPKLLLHSEATQQLLSRRLLRGANALRGLGEEGGPQFEEFLIKRLHGSKVLGDGVNESVTFPGVRSAEIDGAVGNV
jgi:hypothetical protein